MWVHLVCRCETHSFWSGRRKEHQRRRPQAGSWLGTGSLSFPHTGRTREYQKNLALNVMSNSTSKGISWREWFKGYCNKLLSTTSSWCFCQWYILAFVAFYFVVASVQETVLGIIFINHVIVPVQHCHNNPINTIHLSSILCGFIVIIQDTPLYFF